MPYKPTIEGLDFFKNFSLTTGDARWLRLHGENSSQDADINLFNAGARLGQSEAGKDFTVWRHATWDGSTPSDQYIKIGFDGGGSPYAHIKTDGVSRGVGIEGLQVYSESGSLNNMWLLGNTTLNLMGSNYVNVCFGTRGSPGSRYFSFGQNGNHLVLALQGGDYLDIGGRYVTFTASQGNVNLGESGAYYPPTLTHYVRDWGGEGATWSVNYAYDGYTAHTYQVTRSNAGILAFDVQFPVKTTELVIDTTGIIHSTNYFGGIYTNLIQLCDSSQNMYFRGNWFYFSLNNGSFGADTYLLTLSEANFNFAGATGAERGIRFRFTENIIFEPVGGGCVVPMNDASFDLGYYRDATHTVRWKRLYLTNSLTDGVNSITMGNPFVFSGDISLDKNSGDSPIINLTNQADKTAQIYLNTSHELLLLGPVTQPSWSGYTGLSIFANIGSVLLTVKHNQSATGGALTIQPGYPPTMVAAGDLTLSGRKGSYNGMDYSHSGRVVIQTEPGTSAHGGNIELTAANGVGTNKNGGNINLTAGTATGSGTAGAVNIYSNAYFNNKNIYNVAYGNITTIRSDYWQSAGAEVLMQNFGGLEILPGGLTGSDSALFFDQISSGKSPNIKIYNYITAASAVRYVKLAVDDADDYFHLSRQDSNIIGFKIDMTLSLSGSTSDPASLTDGDIWHRTDLDEIRVRLNGTTYKLVVNPI